MRISTTILLGVFLLFTTGCGISSSAYMERRDVYAPVGSSEAVLMAELEQRVEEYIKARLKNPYSATFHQNECVRLPAGTRFGFRKIGEDELMYQVTSRVEATNSYGAFTVSNYVTTARYNPDLHKWEVIKLP